MTPRPLITDHALLRWLERCHGVDISFFRSQMEDEVASALAGDLPDRPGNQVWFVIDEDRVITVLQDDSRLSARRGRSGFVVCRVGTVR